jgi:hypothetical protein
MITLEKNEKLLTDETLSVFEGGIYENRDLVLVIKEGEEIPNYQYQANFIKTGDNI